MNRYRGIVIIVAVLAIIVSLFMLHQPKRTSSTSSVSSTSSLLAIGKQAPLFQLPTISGQVFSLAANKGKTIVMFGMFGSCSDCIPEGQALNQIRQSDGSSVEVIGLDVLNGEPASVLRNYEQIAKINIPLALFNQPVISAYRLTQPEITYIINKNGRLAYASSTFTNEASLQQQVKKAING